MYGDVKRMRSWSSKFFVLMVLGLGASIGSWGQEPPKVQETKPLNAPVEVPAADAPAAPVDPNAFRIGPDVVIAIMVWR